MPTAAKLFAAIFLAVSGVWIIDEALLIYPEIDWRYGPMISTGAVVGFLIGWFGLGTKMKDDKSRFGIALGIRTGVSAFIWVILLFALNHVFEGMTRHVYSQPMSAILQVPNRMIEYGLAGLIPSIVILVLGLSIAAGISTKFVSHKWS